MVLSRVKTSQSGGIQSRTTILVADDHAMTREGLRSLLGTQPDMDVIGEATCGKDAIRLALELEPDVVVMGLTLAGPGSIESIHEILARSERIKIILISLQADQRLVEGLLKSGASGYLVKESPFDELIRAVRTVVQGQNYLTPGITKAVITGYLNMSTNVSSPQDGLSSRECQVLQHIGEGMGTKEIADRLAISAKTVETYRRRIMEKLGIFSTAELIRYAIREGYTSL
jgi:DNA-binding NarL/FixJ family response regulator